jgi:hypothetical protein
MVPLGHGHCRDLATAFRAYGGLRLLADFLIETP